MRTKYAIHDFQQTYFVIESFEKLLAACYQDFAPLYERLERTDPFRSAVPIDPDHWFRLIPITDSG